MISGIYTKHDSHRDDGSGGGDDNRHHVDDVDDDPSLVSGIYTTRIEEYSDYYEGYDDDDDDDDDHDEPSLLSGVYTTLDGVRPPPPPPLPQQKQRQLQQQLLLLPPKSSFHTSFRTSDFLTTDNNTRLTLNDFRLHAPEDDNRDLHFGRRDIILNLGTHRDDDNDYDEKDDQELSIMSSLADEMSLLPWCTNHPILMRNDQMLAREELQKEWGRGALFIDESNDKRNDYQPVPDDDGTILSILSGSVLGGRYASITGRLEYRNHHDTPIQTFRPRCTNKNALIDAIAMDKDDDNTYISSHSAVNIAQLGVGGAILELATQTHSVRDNYIETKVANHDITCPGNDFSYWQCVEKEGRVFDAVKTNHTPKYRLELLQILDKKNDNNDDGDGDDDDDDDDDDHNSYQWNDPNVNEVITGMIKNTSFDEYDILSNRYDGNNTCQGNGIQLQNGKENSVLPPTSKIRSCTTVIARPMVNGWGRSNGSDGTANTHRMSMSSHFVKGGSVATTVSQSDNSDDSIVDIEGFKIRHPATIRRGVVDGDTTVNGTRYRGKHSRLVTSRTVTITRTVSTPGQEPRIRSVSSTTIRVFRRESRVKRILRRCGWKRQPRQPPSMPTIHEAKPQTNTHDVHPVLCHDEIDQEIAPGQGLRRLFSWFR